MDIDARNLKTRLKRDETRSLALEAGFNEAGLVTLPHSHETRDAERYKAWVTEGRAGTMKYLRRATEDGELVRARVAIPFPWARSAIVCLANYNSAQPRSTDPAPSDAGWIARYAWSSRVDEKGRRRPSDYHKVLLKRLKNLEARLREDHGEFESRAYVDTGPVVERALATAAGLGWTAKNTCLIHPKLGSYVFLGVLLTSLDMHGEEPGWSVPDHCGTCRRCLDACPTNALFAPYHMDATKCISYLTIEHRGPIVPELMVGMGRQVFGCDICQDVCPWNRKAPVSADPELDARQELVNPVLDALAEMDEKAFEEAFNGSPVRRAGFSGMHRNIAIAMGNTGNREQGAGNRSADLTAPNSRAVEKQRERFAARLRLWAGEADESLRCAAEWALGKLGMFADRREG
jgi:epoxyqueuosine reductase